VLGRAAACIKRDADARSVLLRPQAYHAPARASRVRLRGWYERLHLASFLRAVSRKSLISLICFGCGGVRKEVRCQIRERHSGTRQQHPVAQGPAGGSQGSSRAPRKIPLCPSCSRAGVALRRQRTGHHWQPVGATQAAALLLAAQRSSRPRARSSKDWALTMAARREPPYVVPPGPK
jgi:hypothetical protein